MDKLSYFKSYIAIVDQGSLKNASDYLNLTPSAVSKHLSTLEQYYSVDLVIRDAKSMRITGEGKVFYIQCKQVLESLARAEELFLNDNQHNHSVLRITLPQVLSQGKFMQMLSAFAQAHPQIKLDLITTNKNLDLVQQDIDFAFRGGSLADSQMRSVKLFQAKTILCAPQSFSRLLTTEQQLQVITEKLLIPSYINLSTLRLYLQKIGIKKPLSHFSALDDAFSYKQAVLAGMGIGIFLDFFVEQELTTNKIWQITDPHPFSYKHLDFNMIYHKNIKLAKSQALLKDFVIDYFGQNKQDAA
ncbi:MAG: hypothetical protein OFPI_35140 [Osedax symbiont Rs2]|nr:MAG: hypothetical protein OFPI_35140 [Osedax symbiont Rs2]